MDAAGARDALGAERADALRRLRGLTETFADIVDSARDSNTDDEHDTEGITIAASRSQVSALAAAAERQIAAVDAALERVADGTYGVCAGCGVAIPAERLQARPATPWCIGCAQQAQR